MFFVGLLTGCVKSMAADAPTYLEFEGVGVSATAPSPEVQLINEVMRDVCPDDLAPTHKGWTECVVNLSYVQIKEICGRLGADAPKLVDALISGGKTSPLMEHDVPGEFLDWRGCFFNSKTGPDIGTYRWHGTGSGWILTNAPKTYQLVNSSAEQTSLTVFDGLATEQAAPGIKDIPLNAVYAYRLTQQRPGQWLATHSDTNQDHINQALHQMGVYAPYCGTKHYSETTSCTKLPSLFVMAVSPTLMVVRSIAPQLFGYQVHGIFWKSVTGHDILEDIAPAKSPGARVP